MEHLLIFTVPACYHAGMRRLQAWLWVIAAFILAYLVYKAVAAMLSLLWLD